MIKCDEDGVIIKGKSSEVFTEITLLITRLIKDGDIDIKNLFTIFEAISLCLRDAFDDKEEE